MGVAAAGDDEQGVNVPVGGAIASLEARFTDRAIRGDKPGDHVLCSIKRCDSDQGILRRAGSAHIGLRVARETLVGIEAGTEAVVRASLHHLGFGKPALTILKERRFVGGQSLQRAARASRTTAHAGVDGSRFGLRQRAGTREQGHSHGCSEPLGHIFPQPHEITSPISRTLPDRLA